MIVLGLTGSIGMGKSTAARLFRRMGVPVHDSDQAVHLAMTKNGAAYADILEAFPEALDHASGGIDRRALGRIVFSDAEKRKTLEEILHPHAQDGQAAFLRAARAKGAKVAVLDIPLLFETGAEDRVDYVLTVTASAATQRRRVLARAGMYAEKFERILAIQMPDLQKRRRSDFVVETGLGLAHTAARLREIVRKLKKVEPHA